MIDWVDFKQQVCDRYTGPEIVETLGLTSEEVYEILAVQITEQYFSFDLVMNGYDNGEEEEDT